jgi:hypothetical protein
MEVLLPEQMVSLCGSTEITGLGFTKIVLVISTAGHSGVLALMV